jgi:hypothetical protein
MTKNFKEFTAKKFDIFLSVAIFSSLGLKLQEEPSAHKREHPALQNMKFLDFFLFLWASFALLDPKHCHCFATTPKALVHTSGLFQSKNCLRGLTSQGR